MNGKLVPTRSSKLFFIQYRRFDLNIEFHFPSTQALAQLKSLSNLPTSASAPVGGTASGLARAKPKKASVSDCCICRSCQPCYALSLTSLIRSIPCYRLPSTLHRSLLPFLPLQVYPWYTLRASPWFLLPALPFFS